MTAIIGGGAAGAAAAIQAARLGAKVIILEKNARILKKIPATGNGRCNFTNMSVSSENYFGETPGFAEHALKTYPPERIRAFFGGLGLISRADGAGRVYPQTNHAGSVADVLMLELERLGVEIITGFEAANIARTPEGFAVSGHTGREIFFDSVIFAAGGIASLPGGSESCFDIVRRLGHRIVPLRPVLVQLKTELADIKGLSGIRVDAEIGIAGKTAKTARGELLFTDYGLSGIAVMSLSCLMPFPEISVNFMPDYTRDELIRLLSETAGHFGGFPVERVFSGILNKRAVFLAARRAGIAKMSRKAASLTREEIARVAETLQNYRIKITGTNGFRNAQACAGGVATDEVDPRTMESRLVPGLFFAGEALDIAGDCGGYNLHWAWASGLIAGESSSWRKR